MTGHRGVILAKPRLPVDLAFAAPEGGAVVTGFLTGGLLRRGQDVVIQPSGKRARIREVRSHAREAEVVQPGRWIAARLADLDPGAGSTPAGVGRGDVVTVAGLGGATDTADVVVGQSGWLAPTSFSVQPLKDRARVRVLAGTAQQVATMFLHTGRVPGQDRARLAQLRFERPVFLFADDQFLLCHESEQVLLAAGRVLDPHGDRKHWQQKAQLASLQSRAATPPGPGSVMVWVQSALARRGIVERAGFLAASSFGADEIRAALEQLAAQGRAVLTSSLAAGSDCWRDLMARAGEAVDRAHQTHPEWVGLPLRDLRARLEDELPLPGAFEAILASLGQSGFVREDERIRRPSHRAQLPPRLQAAGAWLRQVLAEKPLEPPSCKDLTRDADSARALEFLIETGEAVALGPEQVLDANAYTQAVAQIVHCLRQQGQATVSELRQRLGCTRRIMIPLCEKLDREGITRREGDVRRLRPSASPSAFPSTAAS